MPRISLTEQYDNRDVIAQIYEMLDQVATGTFRSVDVQRVGGDYVFTFTDQRGDDHQFTVSANYVSDVDVSRLNGVYTFLFTYADGTSESFGFTINGVKNIASVQSGSTVTVTFTLDDDTTKVITFSAGGDMTTDTAQTVTAVKTFSVSPIVPDTPSGTHAAVNLSYVESTVPGVNNLVHKSANEEIFGQKVIHQASSVSGLSVRFWNSNTPNDDYMPVFKIDTGTSTHFRVRIFDNSNIGDHSLSLGFGLSNSDGIVTGGTNGLFVYEEYGRTGAHVHSMKANFKVCTDSAGKITLYLKRNGSNGYASLEILDVTSGMAADKKVYTNYLTFFDYTDVTLCKTLVQLQSDYAQVEDLP